MLKRILVLLLTGLLTLGLLLFLSACGGGSGGGGEEPDSGTIYYTSDAEGTWTFTYPDYPGGWIKLTFDSSGNVTAYSDSDGNYAVSTNGGVTIDSGGKVSGTMSGANQAGDPGTIIMNAQMDSKTAMSGIMTMIGWFSGPADAPFSASK